MEAGKDTLKVQVKKSEIKAKTVFDYEFLMQKRIGFAPVKMEEKEEEITFIFDISGLRPMVELKEEELEYRYRFLQNLIILRELWDEYDLNTESENIYFDYNYIPYILKRDIKVQNEKNFLVFAKELATGLLCKKYDYEQVHESGVEIAEDEKNVKMLITCETEEDFFKYIQEKAQEQYAVNKNQKIRVDRRKYEIQARMILSIVIVLFGLLIYTGYKSFVILPRSKAVIQAGRNFVVQDYVDCIDALSEIDVEKMDTYTKYILAVSYAKTEALEKEELENVLERLSIYSSEIELEYWIAIGRSAYERAENIAMALSDDKLLIYAYMKELNNLEGNVTMDGEEKQKRVNFLSNEITAIGEKYITESEN